MKVKVNIYTEKTIGAPLGVLIDPVYGEASSLSDISKLISTAMNEASPYITNREVVTMASTYQFSRWMDIVNLQVFLRGQGLVLTVTEVSSDPVVTNGSGVMIEVISPKLEMLPVSTTYYSESGEFDIADIIEEQVNKFGLGDSSLVPSADLVSVLSAIKDMREKGMPVFPMYLDQLQNELADYGFQMFYVFLS